MSRGLSPRVAIVVAQTVLLAAWIASASNWVENMGIAEGIKTNLHNDSDIGRATQCSKCTESGHVFGRATKCDSSDPVKVDLSWQPKDLSPSDQVTVTLKSYKTPHSFNHGVLNMSLYFHGEPDPFLGYTNTISCSDLDQKIVRCPARKGMLLGFTKTVPNLHPLTSFPGHYDVIIDLKNEDNLEMLCVNITLDIKEI